MNGQDLDAVVTATNESNNALMARLHEQGQSINWEPIYYFMNNDHSQLSDEDCRLVAAVGMGMSCLEPLLISYRAMMTGLDLPPELMDKLVANLYVAIDNHLQQFDPIIASQIRSYVENYMTMEIS